MKFAGLSVVYIVRYNREEVIRCCFKISGCLDFDYTIVVLNGIEDIGGSIARSFSMIDKLR